jgi:hypothetical protein
MLVLCGLGAGGYAWHSHIIDRQAETDLPIPQDTELWSKQIGLVVYRMVASSEHNKVCDRIWTDVEVPVRIRVEIPSDATYRVEGKRFICTEKGGKSVAIEHFEAPSHLVWQGKTRRWNLFPTVIAMELPDVQVSRADQ